MWYTSFTFATEEGRLLLLSEIQDVSKMSAVVSQLHSNIKILCNQILVITVSISYGRCSTWRFRFLGDGSAMIIHMEFFTFVDKVVPFNLCVSCIAIVCGSVMINMIMVVIITHHLWYNHKKTPCTTWFLVFFLIDTCLLYYILIFYISLLYNENVKWMETLRGSMNWIMY